MSNKAFGWDLPPGVSLHHIPGNRPEDEEDEAFWTALYEAWNDMGVEIPEDYADEEWFVRAIEICRDLAFNNGYNQGKHDSQWLAEPKGE